MMAMMLLTYPVYFAVPILYEGSCCSGAARPSARWLSVSAW